MWEIRALGTLIPRCHNRKLEPGRGWHPPYLLEIQSDLPFPSLTLSERSRPQQEDTAPWSRPSKLNGTQSRLRPHPKGHQKPEGLPPRGQHGPLCPPPCFLFPDPERVPCNPHSTCTPSLGPGPASGLCPTPRRQEA